MTEPKRLTPRQVDALRILKARPDVEWTGRAFAHYFWPGKPWMTGGSRYDASARCGGSMLARLEKAGLTTSYYSRRLDTFAYKLSEAGRAALEAEANQ